MKLVVGAVTCVFSIFVLFARSKLFSNSSGKMLSDNYESTAQTEVADVAISRQKRTLLFPNDPSSKILMIFGLGTPLQLDRESVIVGAFVKMLFDLPVNSTDFTEPGVHYARMKKSRWNIYRVLQILAELYGFSGKACLLRAICEASFIPFDIGHGLFNHLVETVLSPSSTSENYDDTGDQEYHAAEAVGKTEGESCYARYPECEKSLLDIFSSAYP